MDTKIMQTNFTGSSMLLRADYDPLLESLTVYFRGGRVYEYCGVPKRVHGNLKKADSAGKYFTANIRDKYDFMKKFDKEDTE